MKSKSLFWLLAIFLLTTISIAEPQQPAKGVHRVGVLWAGSASEIPTRLEAFRQGLRDLGYVEKKNIVFEYRFADGKPDRLPALAAELVRLNVDVIVTTAIATRPAKEATNTIPIVTPQFGDPWPVSWLPVWRGREVTLQACLNWARS